MRGPSEQLMVDTFIRQYSSVDVSIAVSTDLTRTHNTHYIQRREKGVKRNITRSETISS